MKWVGRVLLVLLIASILFVAKQNDFQTETAIAQQNSGAIKILTNNLTFSVVGSGVATATQAKINHQTEAVYVNGIKIQNTTAGYPNFELQVFFDLTFYLDVNNPNSSDSLDIPLIGNNTYGVPGICGDGSARLFRGSLLPYETRTIPTNLACADIAYYGDRAQFTAGSIPDSQNSASLNIVLHPNDNVILPHTLIWPAAKITVTDLFPTSGGTHYMSLRLPDNSTRPSISGTLFYSGGTTQSFGAALLDPPGTTYKISHSVIPNNQNPAPLLNLTVGDYEMYEQTVSVTKPNVQLSALPVTITAGQSSTLRWASSNTQILTIDKGIGDVSVPDGSRAVSPIETTTYTITARAQSGATATATATIQVTNDLPDLVPMLTSMEVVTTDKLGRVTIQGLPQVKISDDIVSLTIRNIKIKNIGTSPAVGEIRFAIIPVGGTTVNLNLGSEKEMTLPSLNFKNSVEIAGLWERFTDTTKSSQKVKVDFVVMVDVDQKMTEANESNNRLVLNDFFAWPAIMVSVFTSDNKPVADAVVSFLRTDLKVSPQKSVTDEDGRAFLVPTASPTNAPKYKISVSLGAVGLSPPTPSNIVITDYALYQSSLRLNKTLLIIKPRLYEEWNDLEGKQTELARPTHGGLNIKRLSDNTLFYAPIKNGLAVFPSLENEILLPGDYGLEPSIGRLKYQVDPILLPKFEEIEYRYPEAESPKPIHIYRFSVQTGRISEGGVIFYLPRRCLPVPPIEFCWEDDRDHLQPSIDQTLVPLKTAFNRLQSWPRYKPIVNRDQKILITVNAVNPGYGGEFEAKATDSFPIKLNNRLMLIQVDKARQMVLTHEFFHWLDNQEGKISGRDPYRLGLAVQSNNTGLKLWDITSWTCAFESIPNCGSYSHEVISSEAEQEALAEEFANICSNKEMFARLSKDELLNEAWLRQYSGSIPPDLLINRDYVLKRLSGHLQDRQGQPVSVPQLEAWRDQCLNN